MFWSRSGAFIRRHVETGDAQYFSWEVSVSSRPDGTGRRWWDVFHLTCSRSPLGAPDERPAEDFELRSAFGEFDGSGGATGRLLRLRVSAQTLDLWIATSAPVVHARAGRRAVSTPGARPAIETGLADGAPLLDGGTIVLDGPHDAYRG